METWANNFSTFADIFAHSPGTVIFGGIVMIFGASRDSVFTFLLGAAIAMFGAS